ncbi:hypothetical protein MP638_006218, partial [Amoeboaphelidium occidentale]
MSEKRKLGDIGLDPQEDQGPSRRTPAPTVNPPAADEFKALFQFPPQTLNWPSSRQQTQWQPPREQHQITAAIEVGGPAGSPAKTPLIVKTIQPQGA